MPPDRQPPGSARDWLSRAKGDLALARAPLPEGAFYEDLCYHAHQAAEKAIKAVYWERGWEFRYVHDLDELLAGLRKQGMAIPLRSPSASPLTATARESAIPASMNRSPKMNINWP